MSPPGSKTGYAVWLVLKKNFVLQFRRPVVTVFELLLPIIFICGVIATRYLVPVFQSTEQCFVTFESDQLHVPYTGGYYDIYYTPDNNDTNEIASIIQSHLQGSRLVATEREEDFLNIIAYNNTEQRDTGCFFRGAGIIFHDYSGPDLAYTIRLRHETPTRDIGRKRWYTSLRLPRLDPTGPRVHDNAYLNEGFLHLEHIIGQSLIQHITGEWPSFPPVEVQQLPHHSYSEDQFLPNVSFLLPFCLMVSFIVSVGLFTKELVLEKESRLRETLKMNGLTNGILWLTWFIKQFLFLLLPVLLVGVLLCFGGIFPRSNIAAILIFMFLYLISIICFTFFTSIWFDNSQLGMMAGFIFWFLTLIPHFFIAGFYDDLTYEYKVAACLLPNTCMGLAVNVISALELRGDGLQLADFTRSLTADDPFNMHIVLGMLALDCVALMIVAWYINEWKPGKYGIPRKFYFPFLPSYWIRTRRNINWCCGRHHGSVCPGVHQSLEEEEADAAGSEVSSNHEKTRNEQGVGIDIRDLVKKFKALTYSKMEVLAVNHLHFKVYKGQITALLGHNGAGKTTTMSILTGLFPPDAGSAHINGLSVVDDIDLIRRNLGICPQHNVLFDRLTVNEHLHFFARLRGVPGNAINESVETILGELKLKSHRKYQAKTLSGGYKRKLSVAIALVGNPDVVILDEPTSGMDHYSRILTWELLQKRRNENKTILVSTHSLDDTEKADRIAIMVEGKLACSGRPSWLKKRYGVGYNLRIALKPRAAPTKVEDVIRRYIKDCDPLALGTEIQALLPLDEVGKFQYLFSELERREVELGIASFSVQENKMEDIFIKVGEGENKSWNTQVKQMSRMYSDSRLSPSRPQVLPASPSLNSCDLNTWAFEGTTPSPVDERSNYSHEIDIIQAEDFQQPGYPALDQSKIFSNSLHLSKNPQVSFKAMKGQMKPLQTLKETEEPDDGGIAVSISVPPKPVDKRVAALRDDSARDPSISRSRASSISSVHTTPRNTTPSIIAPIDKRRDSKRICNIDLKEKVSGLSFAIKKWLQQYRAMVTKRYLNFIRFHVGVVWQLLLPLLFVVIGLVLAATLTSHYHPDPSRLLTLSQSASSADNMTLFQASFVNSPFQFEGLQSSLYGRPNLFNYTDQIVALRDNVTTPTDVSECCEYKHQILDKFCATVDKSELMDTCQDHHQFGYRQCLDRCLSCCHAKKSRLASCSNPRYQLIDDVSSYPDSSQFCPVPPKLAAEDYTEPEGPLDSINTYVNEYLLNLQESDSLFFKNVLGGFTISSRTPTHSVCGCDNGGNDTSCYAQLNRIDFINSLAQQCTNLLLLPIYCDDDLEFFSRIIPQFQVIEQLRNTSNTLASSSCDWLLNDIRNMTCNDVLSLLYLNASCQPRSADFSASLCLDTSCDTECGGRSISSQYGCSNWIEEEEDSNAVITLWYNNQPYHVSSSLLNVLHNLYLHNMGYSNVTITVYNHPLPRHPNSTLEAVASDIITFTVGLISMFGFCFLLASFSLFIVQEKSTQAKHLQLSSGLRLSAYWTANFTWDLITSLIPVSTTVIAFAVGQIWVRQYSGTTLAAVMFLFLLVCWAQIPSVYLLSIPFKDIYMAYTSLFLVICLLSFVSLSLIYVIGPISGYTEAADILHYIFLVNPSYGLAAGLSDLYLNHIVRDTCTSSSIAMETCRYREIVYAENPFQVSRPGVGGILIFLLVEGVVYFLLTLVADHFEQIKQLILRRKGITAQKLVEDARKRNMQLMGVSQERPRSGLLINPGAEGQTVEMNRRMTRSLSTQSNYLTARRLSQVWSSNARGVTPHIGEDRSVKAEKRRVSSALKTKPEDCTVLIGRLTKHYNSSLISRLKGAWRMETPLQAAVHDMNVALHERQCFGLLGYNGAGKSTTFKMLTGEIAATAGTALISGYNIRTQLRQVQRNIGYCPQFDALIERLTGRELLTMFARLRGIEEKDIPNAVQTQVENMRLNEHADKQCWKYSGGNRRKLSTAIALLGDPPVILLDEPTSGMDIKTRREFINTLNRIIENENKTVIFSSHSMSECESLCNRIGIMIKGEFRCIGSTEELRNLYGEQETKLTIRVEHYNYNDTDTGSLNNPIPDETESFIDNPEPFLRQSPQFLSPHNLQPSPQPSRLSRPSQPTLQQLGNTVNHRQHTPTAYSRLRSVGRFFSQTLTGRQVLQNLEEIDGGEEEESEDGICDNPYLDEVCYRIREYFRGIRDVKRISAEKDEVTFKLPKYDVPLSEIFKFMQLLKRDSRLHIVSYSVSQSTLEQVFSHFIREQEQQENEKLITGTTSTKT